MDARNNFIPGIAYNDLRAWLALAERLGEVRTVRGASWQEDIGLAAEAVLRAENGPCVVFEDIPRCLKGFRLLLNVFACKPYHWRDKFPAINAPSAEVARRATEKFGWLLDGR